jgi:hypothetical protein
MKNMKENKNKEHTEAFCLKYQETQALEEGCKHPNDYCPHRQSCLIHFYSKEKKREERSE